MKTRLFDWSIFISSVFFVNLFLTRSVSALHLPGTAYQRYGPLRGSAAALGLRPSSASLLLCSSATRL